MNRIHIEAMASLVIEALNLSEAKRPVVEKALWSQWDGKVALVWTRTDIARICDLKAWKRPALDDCDTLLDSLQLESNGVTTETIESRLRDAGLAVPE